jgi:hypothetical protein
LQTDFLFDINERIDDVRTWRALHGRQAQEYLLIIIVARKMIFSRIRKPVKDSDRQAESNQWRGFTLQVAALLCIS